MAVIDDSSFSQGGIARESRRNCSSVIKVHHGPLSCVDMAAGVWVMAKGVQKHQASETRLFSEPEDTSVTSLLYGLRYKFDMASHALIH